MARTFSDIEQPAEQCRFRDCRHRGEPGCAVQAAVSGGDLDGDRLDGMRKLKRELAHAERKIDRSKRADARRDPLPARARLEQARTGARS